MTSSNLIFPRAPALSTIVGLSSYPLNSINMGLQRSGGQIVFSPSLGIQENTSGSQQGCLAPPGLLWTLLASVLKVPGWSGPRVAESEDPV